MRKFIQITFIAFLVLLPVTSWSSKVKEYTIVIKDHKFYPDVIEVPSSQRVKLIIDNLDPSVEEFESHDLKREKIVAGGKEISIFVGPLEKGEYKFFGEFHENTAKGVLIAK